MIRVAAAALSLIATTAVASAQDVRIGDLKAQFYLEGSGKLSEDVLAMKSPNLVNLPRGEGVFGEPVNSVLVNITLLGAKNSQPKHASAMVTITTTNRTGQRRTETKPLLGFIFNADGAMHRPIFVENVTCSKLEIEVKARNASKRAMLDFSCTEPKAAEAEPKNTTVRR